MKKIGLCGWLVMALLLMLLPQGVAAEGDLVTADGLRYVIAGEQVTIYGEAKTNSYGAILG